MNSYRIRNQEEEVQKERNYYRKAYFDSYMHRVYDVCIKNAQKLMEM